MHTTLLSTSTTVFIRHCGCILSLQTILQFLRPYNCVIYGLEYVRNPKMERFIIEPKNSSWIAAGIITALFSESDNTCIKYYWKISFPLSHTDVQQRKHPKSRLQCTSKGWRCLQGITWQFGWSTEEGHHDRCHNRAAPDVCCLVSSHHFIIYKPVCRESLDGCSLSICWGNLCKSR